MLCFVCAFKYLNLKTRFEHEKKLKTKEKKRKKIIHALWALSTTVGPLNLPRQRTPHPFPHPHYPSMPLSHPLTG